MTLGPRVYVYHGTKDIPVRQDVLTPSKGIGRLDETSGSMGTPTCMSGSRTLGRVIGTWTVLLWGKGNLDDTHVCVGTGLLVVPSGRGTFRYGDGHV